MDRKLEEMIDSYGEKLLRYATSILYNHQDAEDVVQDVFVSVYQKYDTSFDGDMLSAWLYKITYNKSINKLKRRRFLIFGEPPREKEMITYPEQTGLSDEMLYALSLLKPEDRALLYGRIIEDYSYEELSQQMGVSSATLRKRYERAKNTLKGVLECGENLISENLISESSIKKSKGSMMHFHKLI